MKRYAGVMSGTSLDGIDVAIADIEFLSRDLARPSADVHLITTHFTEYPDDLRATLRRLRAGKLVPISTVCDLQARLGHAYADSVEQASQPAGIDPSSLAGVGIHGQTVWHAPPSSGSAFPGTLQLGSPAVIAERLGVHIVSNFRSRDMAAGGEGAPLIPFADFILLASNTESRCILNIGGIANLTWIPAHGTLDEVIAFDTGPGNLLIDSLAQRLYGVPIDNNGDIAKQGVRQQHVLAELRLHPYYAKRPPKSTGAEMFGESYAREIQRRFADVPPADLIATVSQLTVESFARSIQDHLPAMPQRVIVGGGGTHNKYLMDSLATALPCPITGHEDYGISSDFKEALAFAILAAATLENISSNVPTATGASGYRVLGSVTRP